MPGQEPRGWIYDEVVAYLEGQKAPADDVEVFEWRPDDMGAEPADWITANPALQRLPSPDWITANPALQRLPSPDRMLRFIDEHAEFTLTSWQRDVVEQFYKDPEDFERRLRAVLSGQIRRASVGTLPPITPPRERRGQNRRSTDWVYVDEIVSVMDRPSKIDEARQQLIDDISDDVEAKVARLQCPRFPRSE
jgi:hypothetical protein